MSFSELPQPLKVELLDFLALLRFCDLRLDTLTVIAENIGLIVLNFALVLRFHFLDIRTKDSNSFVLIFLKIETKFSRKPKNALVLFKNFFTLFVINSHRATS